MPIDYVSEIKTKATSDLMQMLDSLEANQEIPQWPPGKAFEHIVLRAFEIEQAARVVWPFTVPLQGKIIEQIDGAVYVENLACLIETKDYDDPLNIEPIAKLRNQLMRRPSGTMGLVFTMSNFTDPAKSLTRMMNPLSILLWDYHELRYGIENRVMCRGLITKFMYAVEWGMPDYDIRKELR